MRIIDITRELFSCEVYPGDTQPSYTRVRKMPEDIYNLTDITMCVHNATHIDAPRHFIFDGKTIEQLPLDIFYGACIVTEMYGAVTAADIKPLLNNERLLLKGGAYLSREAAEALASSNVRLIGVEPQSVGTPESPSIAHITLLGAGIIPLEGLDLSKVVPGAYTLAAFPLKLSGSDGAPVRAVLIASD